LTGNQVLGSKNERYSIFENVKLGINKILGPFGKGIIKVPFDNHNYRVLIPDILLNVRFEFINFHRYGNELRRHGEPAYMIVHFPPQHITECAFYETGEGEPPVGTPLPIPSKISGCSRLVFTIPSSCNTIPYTLKQLLAWENYPMHVPLQARNMTPKHPELDCEYLEKVESGGPTPPYEDQTSIELPYRLFLSPGESYAGWAHAIPDDRVQEHIPVHSYHPPPSPELGESWTRKTEFISELWHTRFATRCTKNGNIRLLEGDAWQYLRTLSAFWSSDYYEGKVQPKTDPKTPPPSPQTSTSPPVPVQTMTANYRAQIVDLTTIDTFPKARQIEAERLMLTSLGAWMNIRGHWEIGKEDTNYTLAEWVHRTTMGRDQYVKLVNMGYLFPFGHRAACVTISERKFQKPEPSLPQHTAAYLRQHKFIVVLEPKKTFTENDYPNTVVSPGGGNDMPLRTVRIKTHVTPWISNEDEDDFEEAYPNWPYVDKKDFPFHLVAEDWKGQVIEFSAPLMWVPNDYTNQYKNYFDASTLYNNSANRNYILLNGQNVAYANIGTVEDVSFPTMGIRFNVEIPQDPIANPGYFQPFVRKAEVTIPSIKHLAGSDSSCSVFLRDAKEKVYTPGDKSGVFVRLETPVNLAFNASQSGGIATPSMKIQGISWTNGPVGGDIDKLRTFALSGSEDPAFLHQFFADAKILGGVPLESIISPLFSGGVNIPKIETVSVSGASETSLTFRPELTSCDFLRFNETNKPSSFTISATIRTPVSGEPSTVIHGKLENFSINLLDIICLPGGLLEFTSKSGEKMKVTAELGDIEFLGPLAFLNQLQKLIPRNIFSDPPSLDVTEEGISSSVSLGLPPVAIGVFSLKNISLSSSLNIPWMGEASVKFGFAEKSRPFLLTVSVFGGGGFCCLELVPSGMKSIEVGLDFGGCFSLNLGVASGGVCIMAGIVYLKQDSAIKLTGTLKAAGAVVVIKILTISVEFDLGLEYLVPTKEIWGRAVLIVEVKIAFFSKSVKLPMERRFAGSCKSPSIRDLMEFDVYSSGYQVEKARLDRYNTTVTRHYKNYWEAYWDAFAEA
jgi:hypothetical protein